MKAAVISDLHFSSTENVDKPQKIGKYADVFLDRAIRRLNKYIKPDLVFIGGDLVNDANDSDALELLKKLKPIIEKIEAPTIVIPGNHDPNPEVFYTIFERPAEFVDIDGIRFLPFPDDREEPEFNASRSNKDIATMRQHAMAFFGPVISLQHVPLFESNDCECTHNYINRDKIITAMRESGVTATIAGHYHKGFAPLPCNGFTAIATSALCESPFGFLIVDISPEGKIHVEQQQLKMEDKRTLIDWHVHSHFAYCSENMDIDKTIELAKLFGLENFSISEHAGHLTMSRADFRAGSYYQNGLNSIEMIDRTLDYQKRMLNYQDCDFYKGLEIEFDGKGQPTISPEFIKRFDVKLGAVHFMPLPMEYTEITAEFMNQLRSMLNFGVDILAHPFRLFQRNEIPVARWMFPEVASLLAETNTAVEINYHTYKPEYDFYRICLEKGVKISLGSDSHNLCSIGEFYPHLRFLDKLGLNDDSFLFSL